MQVRYQAALRPDFLRWTAAILPLKLVDHGAQLALQRRHVDAARGNGRRGGAAVAGRRLGLVVLREGVVEAVARAADRDALFVEELADAADEQHFVVLVVAPVAAA